MKIFHRIIKRQDKNKILIIKSIKKKINIYFNFGNNSFGNINFQPEKH